MRPVVKEQAPTLAAFGAMMLLALLMGLTLHASLPTDGPGLAALPRQPIVLPGPGQDDDRDSYPDAVDVMDGDASIRIVVDGLRMAGNQPYIVVGTQDDQWRLGRDRELAWPHIVDMDPLGHDVGSVAWTEASLRTGAWWMSEPAEGASKSITTASELGPEDRPEGATWPQTFHVQVRDDQRHVTLDVSLWDADPDPDVNRGRWTLVVDLLSGSWTVGDEAHASPAWLDADSGALRVDVMPVAGIEPATQQEIADRWAPTLHFAGGERFYPLPGDVMERFHGIASRDPDHRTWTRDFNNARDAYLLYLADFNGDRTTDHQDAAIIVDLLRAGGQAPPTVYAHVTNATNDQVIVQYWLLYAYNFVQDERGDDVPVLAHSGDREFIQLRFASLDDALQGRPVDISYSQHYKGIRIPDPGPGMAPFTNATHPDIYVARGSHASYPVPGDDRRLRPAFAGFADFFDGDGEVWEPGNYTVELLGTQSFHQGYLWGPITRHHRELGTSGKPLLQHTFRYPFIDPILWQHNRDLALADELDGMYGGGP